MTPNEIISKARGECRHEVINYCHCTCGYDGVSAHKAESHVLSANFDYTTLPAWDESLFQWIEGEGLWYQYLWNLLDITGGDKHTFESQIMWEIAKSTPAQKAEALSRAITEKEGR